ncbi:Heat shock protein HslJ [Polaromonas sp. OV174]|uniref:DUF4377 domain-containing protein n=1 Tax=Polaromonas sp. OV174 TaxID=1855300 RepID=UPI0008ED1C75|nr:DUF4377 domain-containing protein [Polaromonas sp. OV174]SFC61857.1 Heat shock protein HslJ [Polaromonas sp. OV174]
MKSLTKELLGCGALSLLLLSASLPAAGATKTPAAAATASQQASANSALAWTQWELISPEYAGLEQRAFLKFTDLRLNASVGLNSIGGSYTLDGKKITINHLFSTRMAGPASLMKAEDLYSQALQSVRSFDVSADGKNLSLRGESTLSFRLTGHTPQGFVATESKIINVAPQLGPELDGDKTPKYLQLEDLSQGSSWGRFSEASIEGFDYVPGYRYQMRVVVERNARTNEKRLRLLEVFSQQWMQSTKLEANHKILEVAPTKVNCVGVAPMQCLQVREAGGQWTNFHAPIEGFNFQEGWRYRLQVAVEPVQNPPADASSLRYTLVRILDKLPVIR